jgi:hypothetical protein
MEVTAEEFTAWVGGEAGRVQMVLEAVVRARGLTLLLSRSLFTLLSDRTRRYMRGITEKKGKNEIGLILYTWNGALLGRRVPEKNIFKLVIY